jgi:hypothetical protein
VPERSENPLEEKRTQHEADLLLGRKPSRRAYGKGADNGLMRDRLISFECRAHENPTQSLPLDLSRTYRVEPNGEGSSPEVQHREQSTTGILRLRNRAGE